MISRKKLKQFDNKAASGKVMEPEAGAGKKKAGNITDKPGSQIGSGEKINPPSFGEPVEIELFYRLVSRMRAG